MSLPSRPDSDSPIGSLHSDRMEIRRLREAAAADSIRIREALEWRDRAEEQRDRYRAALEEALEWLPEPERTTIAEVLA